MAEEESVLSSPPTQDQAHHVNDYVGFIRMLKIGAVVCFIVGMGWMMIVKAYW